MPPGTPPIKPPLHPQNPYMDMSSPVTTSSWASPPASAHDGYLPMYPSGSAPGSVGTRSGTHTRSSSFCDEPPESYVPMAPQSVASSVTSRDEEGGSYYMDMQYSRNVPREAHRAHHLRGRPSPASSSLLASSFTRFYLRDTTRRSVPRISPGKGVIIFNSIGRRRFFIAVELQTTENNC